jgi:hypothetical protein
LNLKKITIDKKIKKHFARSAFSFKPLDKNNLLCYNKSMDIRNENSKLIGMTRPQGSNEAVYDHTGKYLGYTNSNGTFNHQGHRVSYQAVPGLLIR